MTYPPRRRWTFFDIDFGHREWSFLPTMMSRCWFVRNPNHYFCSVLQTKSNASLTCQSTSLASFRASHLSDWYSGRAFVLLVSPFSFLCAPLPSIHLPFDSATIFCASFVFLFHPFSFLCVPLPSIQLPFDSVIIFCDSFGDLTMLFVDIP